MDIVSQVVIQNQLTVIVNLQGNGFLRNHLILVLQVCCNNMNLFW